MKFATRSCFLFAVVALVAALSWGNLASAGGDEDAKKTKSKGKRPDVVEVDLNKLPPELAKEIRERLQKKGGKTISLVDAIKIVQAAADKGEVERASRRVSKGETQFHVEVNTGERRLTRYTLNAQGKILGTRQVDAD
jgi:hypothetical protein